MKAPKHQAEGNKVMVGRVEVARFTDNYQAEAFVRFIEKKDKEAIPLEKHGIQDYTITDYLRHTIKQAEEVTP